MIDCTEQAGWVADIVAEEEHIGLPERQGPAGVGLQGPRRVPDSVAHPLISHQAVTHVTGEGCCNVVLKVKIISSTSLIFSTKINKMGW